MGRDVRICFVGDSFVQGTGDLACLGWVGRVAAAAIAAGVPLTAYNLGVRRDTSRDVAARWERECRPRLPELCEGGVVFSFGTNDTTLEGSSARVPEVEGVAHARALLAAARRRFATAFVGPPPIADDDQNRRTRRLSRLLGAAAADEGIPYLDVFDVLRADEVWMAEVAANDGAHPGARGYARLADLVLAWPAWPLGPAVPPGGSSPSGVQAPRPGAET